ncbi:MAG: hypothetical protein JW940_08030 [Polyangiaceae bacterium]|nr:hypothetical protein [Polyangiaceae bacterium]
MDPTAWVLLLSHVGAVLVVMAGAVLLFWVRGKRLRVVAGPHGYVETGLGRFRFDPRGRTIEVTSSRGHQSVPVGDQVEIFDVTDTRSALTKEFLLGGLSMTDLLPAFRDQTFSTVVALGVQTGSLPVLCLRQYRKYEAVPHGVEMLQTFLRAVRLYDDIEHVVSRRKAEIAAALEEQGLRVQWR